MTPPNNTELEKEDEMMEESTSTEPESFLSQLSGMNIILIAACGFAVVALMAMLSSGDGGSEVAAQETSSNPPGTVIDAPPVSSVTTSSSGEIERRGEGRHFYTTIMIPAGAETLYLSGSGAAPKPDGTWGNMEEQTIDTFNGFKQKLQAEGWSMSDIVQVRAFAVAGEFGLLDFDGFNRGYRQFFGTEENPQKPVRSFVQIAGLVVDGWLIEIEVRAARMP